MRDAPAQSLLLPLANDLIALHSARSLLVCGTLIVSTFGLLATVAATAGFAASPRLLARLILISVVVVLALSVLCRLMRWNLISWGLRGHRKQLAAMHPDVLVGIGPGGALIAGMIAKQLIDEQGYEPFVTTIDRLFERKGAYLDVQVGEIRNLTAEMGTLGKPILVVASEVHTGNTLQKVSAKLTDARIHHRTFALLASPSSCYDITYCVLRANERGILPWRDSPARSYVE